MRKKLWVLAAALLACLVVLCACDTKGNPLPQGMEESAVLDQGRSVMELLNQGNWQAVYDQMRSDAKETTSPEGIESYMNSAVEKAGTFEKEEEGMATGQKLDSGEEYATAVFYCKHSKKDVVYRIAFDTDMVMIGLEIKTK